MICRILLLIKLTSCVCGTFVVNVTQTSYQAEENHNITLEWTFSTKPDMSLHSLYIYCDMINLLKNPGVFHLHEGVEVSESQDQQFAGRVQCDKDVLREGRIRLHVSRLRTEDSGLYVCEVRTNDGVKHRGCRLNVSAASELTCSYHPIVALTGDDVILLCSLEPPISASSQTVEWTRPDLDPKYIHVHRDGKLMFELQHPSYFNRTRVFVDELGNGNVSLKIFAVDVSDAGTYRCYLPLMQKEATIKLIVGGGFDTYVLIAMVGAAVAALAALFAVFVCKCRRHGAPESRQWGLMTAMPLYTCDSTSSPSAPARSISPLCSTPNAAASELTCLHQPIVALAGDDIILPCSLEPPISASSQTVEWTRPDLDPKYIHVHRDGKLIFELQHPSYFDRTSLFVDELGNGNVSLKIFSVDVSDAGTYRCYLPMMQKEATIELIVDSEESASEPGTAQPDPLNQEHHEDSGDGGSYCVII